MREGHLAHIPGVLSIQSRPILCNPMGCSPLAPLSWASPGKNTGVGCHFLLQGIFPTQGLNPSLLQLLRYRQILYHCDPRESHTSQDSLANILQNFGFPLTKLNNIGRKTTLFGQEDAFNSRQRVSEVQEGQTSR